MALRWVSPARARRRPSVRVRRRRAWSPLSMAIQARSQWASARPSGGRGGEAFAGIGRLFVG
jgi:hypothetical protein